MRLDEVPITDIKRGWVLVKTKVVQLSITEAVLFRGAPTKGTAEFKAQLEKNKPLEPFGHEFSAEDVEVGGCVTRAKAGDRVAIRTGIPCHNCELCFSGGLLDCYKGPRIGVDYVGCLAEYCLLLNGAPVRLTDNIDDE
jgi:threonine dehydrogenase-like Zn-dependent dehydrogenase